MDLEERNQNMRDFFNAKIDEYDETHEKFMLTKKAITDNLEGQINKVLDLGVGTGLELTYLFEKYPNANVTAIDITENMLEELAKRDFADKVKAICGDFFKVDFGRHYDAVISTSALHHFLEVDKERLYQKIYDSLKLNGVFINSDKIASSRKEEQDGIKDYYKYKNEKPHIDTPLCLESELSLLRNVGFTDIEVKDVDAENYKLIIARKNS
jgi:tRNA (cmo5U34)-methyltransferase